LFKREEGVTCRVEIQSGTSVPDLEMPEVVGIHIRPTESSWWAYSQKETVIVFL
jgi:hypothetical protein